MDSTYSCYATCPKGLEDLLTGELLAIGAAPSNNSIGVVYFSADYLQLCKVCLWSRVANRVYLELFSFAESSPIESDLALYGDIRGIPWEEHLLPENTFAVDFIGSNKAINNTQFGAVRVKDAIVDRLREHLGARPDVAKQDPDLRVQVRLSKGRIQVGLDFGGGSLHQRGYRVMQGAAPLKENLAAAILLRMDWPNLAAQGYKIVDPMCGAGTLLIEALLMQLDCAPGLWRTHYGFQAWRGHQSVVWNDALDEAKARFSLAKDSAAQSIYLGIDESWRMIDMAKKNLSHIGLDHLVEFRTASIDAFSLPKGWDGSRGVVLCNPPYGERLGEVEALRATYLTLAEKVKQNCPNWKLGVFTGNSDLAREMRMRPKKVNKLYNGALPCELFVYDILPLSEAKLRIDRDVVTVEDLSDGALMVRNRILKNQKKLASWIAKNAIAAYRIYDADLPEYAAAIDVYDQQICVQEYAPPKTIAVDASERRLRELITAVANVFSCPPKNISVKTRKINSGKQQYERFGESRKFFTVTEGRGRYHVNLWDYLDTGVFLDHRPLRLKIYQQAQGKKFLNLFCYTATATVQAAIGGASSSVSVDMSNTYLQWAAKNFALNNISGERHKLVQADCIKWLEQCREGFDVIMLDPPTFSNSKRMEGVLDVQRDHVTLIKRCMDLLQPGGTLYFSNNLRSFKLERESLDRFGVEDITPTTIDRDFERNPKIHHCFEIRHQSGK